MCQLGDKIRKTAQESVFPSWPESIRASDVHAGGCSIERRQLSAFTTHIYYSHRGEECVCVGKQRTAVSGCGQCSSTSPLPNYIQVRLHQDLTSLSCVQRREVEVCRGCIWCQVTATPQRDRLFSVLGHVQASGVGNINQDRHTNRIKSIVNVLNSVLCENPATKRKMES